MYPCTCGMCEMKQRERDSIKKEKERNCTSVDCGIIHLFSDRKTHSQYLFIYVPLATCFLKLILKNAHLVHCILPLEKQTSYEYSYYWQMPLATFAKSNPILSLNTSKTKCKLQTIPVASKTGHKRKD